MGESLNAEVIPQTGPAGGAAAPFAALFEPLRLGPLVAPNRIVFGAHHTGFAEPSGTFGEPGLLGSRTAGYVGERAAGGAGTVIVGQAAVHPDSAHQVANQAVAWDRAAIEGLVQVADAVHAHGALALIQLSHNGAMVGGAWSKRPARGASLVGQYHEAPAVMSPADITEVVTGFARSARNAVAAGLDGVEVHAAHGYLLAQFLSPRTNTRTDEWGGGLTGRMRLLCSVLEAARARVGDTRIVGVRLVGDEEDRTGTGLDPDQCAEIAGLLAQRGLVDYVSVSVGSGGLGMVRPMYTRPAYGLDRTRLIAGAVGDLPTFAVGRFVDPQLAHEAVASGATDAVVLVRALMADPQWPLKARTGKVDHIRLCTGCNQSCYGNLTASLPVTCATNPAVGREPELGAGTMTRARESRRVVVVGGGPAGLEAAWVAAARGHRVTLVERNQECGGAIRLAQRVPGRGELGGFVEWRLGECRRRGVEILTGVEADADWVTAHEPDAVVVATGGRADVTVPVAWHPPIAGTEHALDHITALERVLELGPSALGERVLVVDLVGFVEGLALAELVGPAARVCVAYPFAEPVAADPETRMTALRRAARAGAELRPYTGVIVVEARAATLVDLLSGRLETQPFDTVVVRTHGRPLDGLAADLRAAGEADGGPEVHVIGDAVAARLVDKAIAEGHRLGRML